MSGPVTIPDDLLDLVTTDRVGAVSWARPDGTVVSHLMWIDWDGEHLLTSSPIGSVKGQHARRTGHVSMVVADRDDPWRFVNIRGRVSDIVPDENLEFIDRMSVRYTGQPYFRRGFEREVFVITPDHIHVGRGGWARKPST